MHYTLWEGREEGKREGKEKREKDKRESTWAGKRERQMKGGAQMGHGRNDGVNWMIWN